MAIEPWLCLSCVMEKCHKLSIVPYEIGYRLGRAIVLFQFAWISSVACWLAATPFWLLTNSICTRDATSSHEADGNKPSIITSNKQDAINCLPHQLKCVPWYSMRTWLIILMVWLIGCQWGEMNCLARNQSLVEAHTALQRPGLFITIQLIHLYCSSTITTCDYRELKWNQTSWVMFKKTSQKIILTVTTLITKNPASLVDVMWFALYVLIRTKLHQLDKIGKFARSDTSLIMLHSTDYC